MKQSYLKLCSATLRINCKVIKYCENVTQIIDIKASIECSPAIFVSSLKNMDKLSPQTDVP